MATIQAGFGRGKQVPHGMDACVKLPRNVKGKEMLKVLRMSKSILNYVGFYMILRIEKQTK